MCELCNIYLKLCKTLRVKVPNFTFLNSLNKPLKQIIVIFKINN